MIFAFKPRMTQATATIIPTNVLAVAAFEFTFYQRIPIITQKLNGAVTL